MVYGNACGNVFMLIGVLISEDIQAPTLLLAEVGNAGDDKLRLIYGESLDESSTPAVGDFSIGGTSETVSFVVISGQEVTLTLSGDINSMDTITVNYTAGTNPIRDQSENDAVDLTNQAVTNNILNQYIIYPNTLITTPSSTIYNDGTTQVRKRIVSNVYNIDITLTATGFSGSENTDWEWAIKYNGQDPVFRSGVRGGDFVVDCEITVTGFAGTEDVDWENLSTASGGGVQTTYRDGVRDESYVIDKALTATGFEGTEDIDWENLRQYKLV